MMHPDPALLRARLRDVCDLGFPSIAAVLLEHERRGELELAVESVVEVTISHVGAESQRGRALRAILDDLADDLAGAQ